MYTAKIKIEEIGANLPFFLGMCTSSKRQFISTKAVNVNTECDNTKNYYIWRIDYFRVLAILNLAINWPHLMFHYWVQSPVHGPVQSPGFVLSQVSLQNGNGTDPNVP